MRYARAVVGRALLALGVGIVAALAAMAVRAVLWIVVGPPTPDQGGVIEFVSSATGFGVAWLFATRL